jgi:hypothetical protein
VRALAVALGLALCASDAPAAPGSKRPPLTRTLRGEALAAYEAARRDFKDQHFQAALSGFVRAFALSREPRLLWNQAACLRKLERNAEALRALDAYLAQGGQELSAEERAEAEASRQAVRQLVAVVRFDGALEGVEVSVDGAPVADALEGGLYLEPGPHAMLLRKAGFREQLRQQPVRPGEAVTWKVALEPLPPPTPTGAVVPPPERLVQAGPRRRPWAPWLVVGGGAAVAAAGGVLLGVSAGTYGQLRAECGTMCAPARVASGRAPETAGLVLLGVGAAAAVGGLGWWLFSGTSEPVKVTLSPAGASLEGRF